MPPPFQVARYIFGNASLKFQVVGFCPPASAQQPARCIDGILRVHAKVHHAGGHGCNGLRLAVAAHTAVNKVGFAVFEQHGWCQGVQGALARMEAVNVARFKGKGAAPVLQHKARAVRHKSRAKFVVDALDERHRIAPRVHHAKPDGIAARGQGGQRAGAFIHTYARRLLPRVFRRKQPGSGNVGKVRVCEVVLAVNEGLARGLGHDVIVVGRAFTQGSDIHLVEDVKNFKRSQPLTVGGWGAGRIAPVVHAQRFGPVGRVAAQVILRNQPAVALHGGHNGPGYVAAVKFLRPLGCQAAEGAGKVRLVQNRGKGRGMPLWRTEKLAEFGAIGQAIVGFAAVDKGQTARQGV